MWNQKIVATLGLALSGFCFSGTMGSNCTSNHITVPCITPQWDIGIQALYLKPTYSYGQRDHAIIDGDFKEIENRWGFGYRLNGSYHFNTGNALNLDWTHYDVTTRRSVYSVSQPNQLNQANLVLGQQIHFSDYKRAQLYGGLQYANIRMDYLQNGLTLPPVVSQIGHADFNGVGPTFGIQFAYFIGSGLSLTADTNTSILLASERMNVNQAELGGIVYSTAYISNKHLVPGVQEKLGLNYQYQFSEGLLTLDGGYQALNYFNVMTPLTASGIANSNFGLFGPYFGIHWLSMV